MKQDEDANFFAAIKWVITQDHQIPLSEIPSDVIRFLQDSNNLESFFSHLIQLSSIEYLVSQIKIAENFVQLNYGHDIKQFHSLPKKYLSILTSVHYAKDLISNSFLKWIDKELRLISLHDKTYSFKAKGQERTAAATYLNKEVTIYFNRESESLFSLGALVHEYGHALRKAIGPKVSTIFDQICWGKNNPLCEEDDFVTEYASVNKEEDFSEAFRYFHISKNEFKAKDPDKYQYFQTLEICLSSQDIYDCMLSIN